MAPGDLLAVAKDYVQHLVLGDYGYTNGLGELDPSSQLPEYLALVVGAYGGTLTDPPETAFVAGPPYAPLSKYLGIRVHLWTLEEGEANMQMDLDITLVPPYRIVVTGLVGCPPRLIPALQEVVHHLVAGDYRGLEEHGHLRRYGMTGEDVEGAIVDYRDRAWAYGPPQPGERTDCMLVDIPAYAFKGVFGVHTFETPGCWTVEFPLWWKNDCAGHDLTLRTEIEETVGGVDVQVMGIEVM
jgi:hypothetical protein